MLAHRAAAVGDHGPDIRRQCPRRAVRSQSARSPQESRTHPSPANNDQPRNRRSSGCCRETPQVSGSVALNIRKYAVRAARLTPQAADFLDASVVAGLNIVVSGATQAGKARHT